MPIKIKITLAKISILLRKTFANINSMSFNQALIKQKGLEHTEGDLMPTLKIRMTGDMAHSRYARWLQNIMSSLAFQMENVLLKIIIFIYIRMLTSKENYLNIQYERGRGLKLNWNFKDILGREKYFRHLIIIADYEKEFINTFVENFYKRMKYGDILSCIYFTPEREVRLCDWVQKTHINKFKVESYLKYMSYSILDAHSKIELLKRAALQTSQKHDFMVVNVLMDQKDSSNFYKEFVENRRLNNDEFNYIVNIFGKTCQNRVSVYKGINLFKSSLENVNEYTQFYHNFINSAVIPYASIKIECLNGQIGLFNEHKWRSEDFNIIQAKFYGPSSQFKCDQLLFYIQDLTRQMNIQLQITLNFKLFTLKKYETVKKMHLTYNYEKDGSLTMHEIRFPRYKIFKDIYLEEDPYESITVVKIFQNVDNNSSDFSDL